MTDDRSPPPDRPPPDVYDGGEYVFYLSGDDIQLDGEFTADELIKIAGWLQSIQIQQP